jgi:glycosyltransferase involved in cell wall biosynthesis
MTDLQYNMKPKVLLLQAILSSYRVPIYEIISQNIDLTVAYTHKNECSENVVFKIMKLDFNIIGGVVFIKRGFKKICSQYDVVIFMADLHFFSYCSLPFISRKYKVIPWTIGIRSSYTLRYDVNRKKGIVDKLYGKILNKSDAIIFYGKEPIKFWENRVNKNKIFIAHNTVEVFEKVEDTGSEKNSVLFIGTLYKEKRIYELIDAFIEVKKKCDTNEFFQLDIIGNGDEYENINDLIERHGLSDYILLHGPIYDEQLLAKYFSKSLICVSPDQAGLSVLKSMGYGVPYVTRINAITGGERFNIIDKYNGLFYCNQEELVSIIEDVYKNPERFIAMGKNAYNYYHSNSTPKQMAKGVIDAINFVLK